MWARTAEVMLGLWLAITPFVFGYAEQRRDLGVWWAIDLALPVLIWTLSFLSFWSKARRAHLGVALLGVVLAVYAYFAGGHPAPPVAQNHLIVGLLLLMLGIIPSENEKPPLAWRRFYEESS